MPAHIGIKDARAHQNGEAREKPEHQHIHPADGHQGNHQGLGDQTGHGGQGYHIGLLVSGEQHPVAAEGEELQRSGNAHNEHQQPHADRVQAIAGDYPGINQRKNRRQADEQIPGDVVKLPGSGHDGADAVFILVSQGLIQAVHRCRGQARLHQLEIVDEVVNGHHQPVDLGAVVGHHQPGGDKAHEHR